MSAVAEESLGALLWRRWRDPAAWITTTDIFIVLIALSLPWSTSLVAIFAVAALVTMVPFFDAKAFLQSLKRPVSVLPVALFVLALVGTLWSDAPWGARLYAVSPAAKLLMLPVLFYHFERSARGLWVFFAFLVSCILLMAMSWIVTFDPLLAEDPAPKWGSQSKTISTRARNLPCALWCWSIPLSSRCERKETGWLTLLGAVSLSFIVNMLFVSVSRTALVTIPIMLVVFALLHLKWRSMLVVACAVAVLGGTGWATSPQLRCDHRYGS